MTIRELDRVVDLRAGFTKVHVVAALLALENGPLGRAGLMGELGLNEASVKTMTRRLGKLGYVQPSTKGQVLSKRGIGFARYWKRKCDGPLEIKGHELSTGKVDCGILVRGGKKRVGNGQEIRDEAIKSGAAGASVAVVGDIISVPFCKIKIKSFEGEAKRLFRPERGDALIIASAGEYRIAKGGALAGAISILD